MENKYEILKDSILGEGAYGKVFLGRNKDNYFAIKYESFNTKDACLANEIAVLQDLSSKKKSLPILTSVGIPEIYDSFTKDNDSFMVIQLLGQSLKERQNEHKFTIKEIAKIGIDLLNTIQFIHECSYVYVDVKPENFLFGKNEQDKEKLYIVDYGLSHSYLDPNGKHKKFNENQHGVRGSVYYASIWNHYGIEYSRRDDVSALGYVLVRLVKGKLPWENMIVPILTPYSYELKVLGIKIGIEYYLDKNTIFYEDVPKNLKTFMDYCCTKICFEDAPDYEFLRQLLSNMSE